MLPLRQVWPGQQEVTQGLAKKWPPCPNLNLPTSPWLDFRLFWHIFLWPCYLPTADQTFPQSQKLYHLKFGLALYKKTFSQMGAVGLFLQKKGAGHGVEYVGLNCENVTPASACLEWAAYIWSCLKRKWKTKCEKPWVDGGAVSWKRLLSSSSEAGAASHLFVEAATINQSDTKVTKVTPK